MNYSHSRMFFPTNELAHVRQGIVDGHVTFTYRVTSETGFGLRVKLAATREETSWRLVVMTGDGRKIERAVASSDIERELTESVLLIRSWIVEKAAPVRAFS